MTAKLPRRQSKRGLNGGGKGPKIKISKKGRGSKYCFPKTPLLDVGDVESKPLEMFTQRQSPGKGK